MFSGLLSVCWGRLGLIVQGVSCHPNQSHRLHRGEPSMKKAGNSKLSWGNMCKIPPNYNTAHDERPLRHSSFSYPFVKSIQVHQTCLCHLEDLRGSLSRKLDSLIFPQTWQKTFQPLLSFP